MLSSQLFWRVLLVYISLTVGIALSFYFLLSQRYQSIATHQVEQRLTEDIATVAELLSASRGTPGAATIPAELLNAAMRGKVTRVAVTDAAGKVLWPQADTAGENHIPAVFDTATAQEPIGEMETVTVDDADGRRWLVSRRKLPEALLPAVEVRGAFPITHLQRELSAATVRIWLVVATAAAVSLAIAYVFVARITEPLEVLTHAAQDIASGEFPAEIPVHSRNEIGSLAQAFNLMNRKLTDRIEDLQDQRRQSTESHHRLEAVLSAMVEGVMAIDADQQILLANQAAVNLLDLRRQSMVGRPFWEAVRQPQLQQLVNAVLAEKPFEQVEIEIARTQSTLAVTATRFASEPRAGAVLVMHDVTELRRLENLRREFVQNVSHELKTPLSSIAAYADTLLEGGLEDEGSNRLFVQRIAEQSDRLHTLILDLLALARMESDEQTFLVLPTDVSRIVQTSLDAHQAVASTKQIHLSGQGCSGSLMGMADDDGLRTIIDNLLDNALNYTPQHGRVQVRCQQRGEWIILEVEDTGVGIAKEHQNRIFERFFRIDRARSREMGGTGLGLAIVKHLCQMFGGSVKVNSQLGRGSTFTVQLPAAVEEAFSA